MSSGLFDSYGIHAVVDGQFGSTGKGALSAFLAERAVYLGYNFYGVVSNAGPNSGHTHYHRNEKHVLKQLPSFAVAYSQYTGHRITAYLSAGAIIDIPQLVAEARKYKNVRVVVDPRAAVVTEDDKNAEHFGSIAAVAGTRSGTGSALARKVLRQPLAVLGNRETDVGVLVDEGIEVMDLTPDVWDRRWFMEVSQGFSLGLNSMFYPKVTSRECTVMQGIADARIPPSAVRRVYLSTRTFPIRVGNVDGHSSGDCYPDQREITWDELGVEPELTTVTKRVRRVFTFSEQQVAEAVMANMPAYVFVNFMNYLDDAGKANHRTIINNIRKNTGCPFGIIESDGAHTHNVKVISDVGRDHPSA